MDLISMIIETKKLASLDNLLEKWKRKNDPILLFFTNNIFVY
jgi:hypothetical protein